jgi:ribonuclease-3
VTAAKLASRFAKRTGYTFKDASLLLLALTHSSLSPEDDHDNERLEFLGDRVLALVIAEELFQRFPTAREGELARRLNTMVRKESCADVARQLNLGHEMKKIAGTRARRNNIYQSQNVLGDACEAVLASIYFDGGLPAARKFILKYWREMLDRKTTARRDPKSALQEWALGQGLVVPVYREVSRTGPDHAPEFVMSVEVKGKGSQQGEGSSKRIAEQSAATALLKQMKVEF